MKKIGIYTKNFALYHDLLEILKKRNINYISLSSLDFGTFIYNITIKK